MRPTAPANSSLRRALMLLPVAGAVAYWLADDRSARHDIREVDVAQATSLLNRAGYVNAVNLKPGIEGWAAAGLPIQQSPG